MVQDEHLLGERAMPSLAVEILEDLEADPGVASNPKIYPPSFLQGLARRAARLASAGEREALIASVLEGRREVVFHSPHHTHSSDPHVSVDKIPRAVSEFMERYQKGAYRFVGIGKSGVVLSSKRFAGRCHKIRLPLSPQPDGTNSVEQEYDMQKRIASMPTTSRVRVPVADTLLPEYGGIIVMDKVRGITIRDILLGQEKVPPEFDVKRCMRELRTFVGEMHALGYHHRDLHAGNIMIDEEGMPWIIDFGMAARVDESEDPYRIANVPKSGHFVDVVLKSDLENLSEIERRLRLRALPRREEGGV